MEAVSALINDHFIRKTFIEARGADHHVMLSVGKQTLEGLEIQLNEQSSGDCSSFDISVKNGTQAVKHIKLTVINEPITDQPDHISFISPNGYYTLHFFNERVFLLDGSINVQNMMKSAYCCRMTDNVTVLGNKALTYQPIAKGNVKSIQRFEFVIPPSARVEGKVWIMNGIQVEEILKNNNAYKNRLAFQ
ncbi:hypothetical protein [Falsibacillus albus]|uniref:Uncharacterized protein n=1 Tax=Falsibacillus albus TaxID=2478915 RepID=A0A3L7K5C2_9BACI|nr:hypothetical protein [Falsibacillus albus]RLQ98227.1 hypothetical protein D9X91_02240 [Falsibacillus albus]